MSKHKMHFLMFTFFGDRPRGRAACAPSHTPSTHPLPHVVTYDKSLVTCKLCKRTRYFKRAQAPKEGPQRH